MTDNNLHVDSASTEAYQPLPGDDKLAADQAVTTPVAMLAAPATTETRKEVDTTKESPKETIQKGVESDNAQREAVTALKDISADEFKECERIIHRAQLEIDHYVADLPPLYAADNPNNSFNEMVARQFLGESTYDTFKRGKYGPT